MLAFDECGQAGIGLISDRIDPKQLTLGITTDELVFTYPLGRQVINRQCTE
jgi:hypothetical protein